MRNGENIRVSSMRSNSSIGMTIPPGDPFPRIVHQERKQSKDPEKEHGGPDPKVRPAVEWVGHTTSASRHVDVLLLHDLAQLLHRPGVQLANALLGDAELLADLLQRHRL